MLPLVLFGLFAEIERDLIAERTKEGMKPPRSKLRGIRRKGIVGETPRFLPPLPFAR